MDEKTNIKPPYMDPWMTTDTKLLQVTIYGSAKMVVMANIGSLVRDHLRQVTEVAILCAEYFGMCPMCELCELSL